MPTGGRPRQLSVRSLMLGVLLALADDRPAQLVRVHQALVGLDRSDQIRLGVVVVTKGGDHLLTYRQVERTFNTWIKAMADAGQDALGACLDAVLEATIPPETAAASASVAVDWTDLASWARARPEGETGPDAEASWGHRNVNAPGTKTDLFFGYYAQALTMVAEEAGAPVANLIRRVALSAPSIDPVGVMVKAITTLAAGGVRIGDVLADAGYAARVAANWAAPLRRIGAALVVDLHPADRGPKGSFEGAIAANGNLYCPAVPKALLSLGPPGRGTSPEELAAHDRACSELALYKLGRISADDAEGYHRVACPASAGKLRCPLKPASMSGSFKHPEVLSPPEVPPRCCVQATITVPPSVNAKTRQKHDYPSPAHRASYARRTAAERSFAATKDTSRTNMARGWCRMMGRAKNLVMWTAAAVVTNLRLLAAFRARQAEAAARAAAGLPPRSRRRRRSE